MIAEPYPPGAGACPCCMPRRGFLRGFAGVGAAATLASRTAAAATDQFRDALAQEELCRPAAGAPRLVSGLDGAAVFDPKSGFEKLALQISQTLDWEASLVACREYGAEQVLELGPGHALATMAREALPEAHVHALEDFRSTEGIIRWIKKVTYPVER